MEEQQKILHVCLDTVNAICYCCHAFLSDFVFVRIGIPKKKQGKSTHLFPLSDDYNIFLCFSSAFSYFDIHRDAIFG